MGNEERQIFFEKTRQFPLFLTRTGRKKIVTKKSEHAAQLN